MPQIFNPDTQTLRRFGWIAAVVFLGVCACCYGRWGRLSTLSETARVLVSVAALAVSVGSMIASLMAPQYNRPLYILLSVLAYPMGVMTEWILLLGLFFLVITPVAIVSRWLGHDPLRLKSPREETYWRPVSARRSTDRYFRMF